MAHHGTPIAGATGPKPHHKAPTHRLCAFQQAAALAVAVALPAIAYALDPTPPTLLVETHRVAVLPKTSDLASGVNAPHLEPDALDAIARAPSTMAIATGRSNLRAVLNARAVQIVLPGQPEPLLVDNLEIEPLEHGGFSLTTPVHQRDPAISLIAIGSTLYGTIEHDGAHYVASPLGDGRVALHRVDLDEVPPVPQDRPDFLIRWPSYEERKRSRAMAQSRKAAPAGEPIDALVLYTPRAAQNAGDIEAAIAFLVLETNRMFEASGANARLRLVHTAPADHIERYDPNDSLAAHFDALDALADPEGVLADEAQTLREHHFADVVYLVIGTAPGWCGGGVAYLYQPVSGDGSNSSAVSGIGGTQCRSPDAQTFAHETGHLLGGLHNPEEIHPDYWAPFAYGYGHCNARERWRTIMSYNTEDRCPEGLSLFAGPRVIHRGAPTGDTTRHDVVRLSSEVAPYVAGYRQSTSAHQVRLPLFLPDDAPGMTGFLRLWNPGEEVLDITVRPIDDAGTEHGALTLSVAPDYMRGLSSRDLERGSTKDWVAGRAGDGEGNWRLVLEAPDYFEARAYVRASGGLVAPVHSRAEPTRDAMRIYHVPFFNPASNTGIRSLLRITNLESRAAAAIISAWDSNGYEVPYGVVVDLAPHASTMVSAQALEHGAPDDDVFGVIGDGAWKWRFEVHGTYGERLDVMSLLSTHSGHLINVSR